MSPSRPFAAAVAGLLASIGCGPRESSQELTSVSEASAATSATRFSFTAEAKTEWLGRHTWSGVRHPRGVGRDEAAAHEHAMWVVPVFDPGAEPSSEVHLWLTYSGKASGDESPDAWIAEIKERFDGQKQTLSVRGRASDAGAGWVEAIKDAEAAHGLQSHAQAPVVPWPPR